MSLLQEASKNASELLQAEEEEKKKAEKRRMKNKKASHLQSRICPQFKYHMHVYAYVAVLGRNRTLFRCVIRPHYCV